MVLIGAMGGTLVALGALFGTVYNRDYGAAAGAILALGVWGVMVLIAFAGGDKVLLMSAGAKKIEKEDAPRLWNVVEEMTIAAGLGRMPDVYVIDDPVPNAFAVGRDPSRAAVAVTQGLLRRLNRDELQGVVAHEIGHIRNQDVKFMTLASVMLGSMVLLSDVFLRSLWFGGGRRRGGGRGGGGQAQMIIVLVAVVMAILAPILARLLYLACSRQREYLADASAARFTRYPAGLASALEKISRPGIAAGMAGGKKTVNRALAPLFIVRPERALTGLFSTHPPTEERIRILRSMGGGAGYADYEKAWKGIHGGKPLLDGKTVEEGGTVQARQPTPEKNPKQEAVERTREVLELFQRTAGFLVLACPCGVRIKVPPGYAGEAVDCTRCGRRIPIPKAGPSGKPGPPAAEKAVPGGEKEALTYRRRGKGWETFQCSCGRNLQLSPSFAGRSKTCPGCGKKIRIDSAAG